MPKFTAGQLVMAQGRIGQVLSPAKATPASADDNQAISYTYTVFVLDSDVLDEDATGYLAVYEEDEIYDAEEGWLVE